MQPCLINFLQERAFLGMVHVARGSDGLLCFSVSFGKEMWTGGIAVGAVCTQMVTEVVEVKTGYSGCTDGEGHRDRPGNIFE